jgi:hypothetical protein
MPPDTVLESRKLTGSVLLKKGAYERIDDHYRLRHGTDEQGRPLSSQSREWYERRVQTDDVLLYLTDRYLRELSENGPEDQRAKYQLMHRFMRNICLNEYTAGGMVELERLEKLGRHNHTIRTGAGFARAAIEEILDELSRRNFRLEVDEDKKAKDKYQAMCQDRRAVHGTEDSWRLLAEERRTLVCEGMGSKDATEKVAQRHDVAPSKVYRACKFVQEESRSWHR